MPTEVKNGRFPPTVVYRGVHRGRLLHRQGRQSADQADRPPTPLAHQTRFKLVGSTNVTHLLSLLPVIWNDRAVFLSYPFMRLVGAFNPILEIAAFGWQQLRYGVDAVRNPHTEMWYVIDRLSDFEFVAAHNVLDDNRMESRGKSNRTCRSPMPR
jgi:hypothetical protein